MAEAAERASSLELIAAPAIEKRIFVVRGRQVMLDEDLADLYGVETKRLIQQVKRNSKRFPQDFMFQLDKAETEALRSQIATSKDGRVGAATPRMSSPSRVSPCSQVSSEATEPSP
jgi:ORF6N domain